MTLGIAIGAAAAIVLGAASTVGLAATSGAFHAPTRVTTSPSQARCTATALPGAVVDVTLTDIDGMMGGQHGANPTMGTSQGWWGMGMPGMMRIVATPSTVLRGTVSLRVANTGVWTHELVALPLPTGHGIGQRRVGANGKVDEQGSLGEASRTCGAGAGDGIASGATGWITLPLSPGRYELICNLPRHYASGMYTELDIT
jgi:uncharacterized cupredoxin-like copper-binding protein